MKTTQPPTPAAHCASMLAQARADMASECARRGPAGALARAVLRLVEMLITLLADFRAGPLAVPEPRASANAGAAGAEGEANPLPHNERRITQAPVPTERGASGLRVRANLAALIRRGHEPGARQRGDEHIGRDCRALRMCVWPLAAAGVCSIAAGGMRATAPIRKEGCVRLSFARVFCCNIETNI